MSDELTLDMNLEPEDPSRLAILCGPLNGNLTFLEERLGVKIRNRSSQFSIAGEAQNVEVCGEIIADLYAETAARKVIDHERIHLAIQSSRANEIVPDEDSEERVSIRTRKELIEPRGSNQRNYVRTIRRNDINFGIGPAGTGKTYLAVACAVEALDREEVSRILLVRPAVEAGEKLGFLPGDLAQKIDPYLRPLYDALWEMMGFDTVTRLIERNVIEVAPLAYMRGRTLNHSFIILDESQNTTKEQMKMFLTRIGFGSTAVITGDITQTDLPKNSSSGLVHASKVLKNVNGISFTHFQSRDVIRHPLVQRIVEAYDRHDDAE